MTDMKKMNEQELETVAGGMMWFANSETKMNTVIRSGAGFAFPENLSVKNGYLVKNSRQAGRRRSHGIIFA